MLTLLALLLTQVDFTRGPSDYSALTTNRREVANFNVETIRGMAENPANGQIYALNTHASLIVRHDNLTPAAEATFQTILNPVSIALWTRPGQSDPDRILVVGAGTHALAVHRMSDGAILDLLQLPSEPADLVVHEALDLAFVSCQGANSVARIDLTTLTSTSIPVPSQRPRFLSLDPGTNPTSTADDVVYVAPFASGNSTALVNTDPTQRSLVFDPTLPPPAGLGGPIQPDEDLYSIAVQPGAIAVVAKQGIGTLLTAHGRNPARPQDYWMLNIDSLNGGPDNDSEPEIRGRFVKNRLWIGTVPGPGLAPGGQWFDLDQRTPGAAYQPANSVAFPFGLAFEPTGLQRAFVASPLNDRVALLVAAGTTSGTRLTEVNLPSGSIPLSVVFGSHTSTSANFYVYCWGSNTVQVRRRSDLGLAATLELGLDPTPAPIKRGRNIWYDGERSANARSSCNSCHPGGKSDFLGWQISDGHTDRKDVMVTQSLLSIHDTFPYHWRGERDLLAFNGAFVDLLGAGSALSTAPNGEFSDFQAFVFSLEGHANPRAHPSRTVQTTTDAFVDPDPEPTEDPELFGDAVNGELAFRTPGGVGGDIGLNGQTCAGCHIPQSGSNGEFLHEIDLGIPSAHALETPHLRELTHRDQENFLGRARTGFGIAHQGIHPSIFEFLRSRRGSFAIDKQKAADLAAFVRRFDAGIAPAAHVGVIVDAARAANATLVQDTSATTNELFDQLTRGWIDLVAFGTFTPAGGGAQQPARWWVNQAAFCNSSEAGASMSLTALLAQCTSGQASVAFLGFPLGSGIRFAVDRDNDLINDSAEIVLGTDPMNPDTDRDGDPDGHEANSGGAPLNRNIQSNDTLAPNLNFALDYASASMAKFRVESAEQIRVDASASSPLGPTRLNSSPVFARWHTFAAQGLSPSTSATAPPGVTSPNPNTIQFTVTDLSGNRTSGSVQVTPLPMIHPTTTVAGSIGLGPEGSPLIVSLLGFTKSSSGSALTLNLSATIRHRYFDAAGQDPSAIGGRAVLFQVLRESPVGSNLYVIDSAAGTSGVILSTIPLVQSNGSVIHLQSPQLDGPFLRAADTTGSGQTSMSVTVFGLATGQKVRVRVIGILEPTALQPNQFVGGSQLLYSLPPTQPDNRGIEAQFP